MCVQADLDNFGISQIFAYDERRNSPTDLAAATDEGKWRAVVQETGEAYMKARTREETTRGACHERRARAISGRGRQHKIIVSVAHGHSPPPSSPSPYVTLLAGRTFLLYFCFVFLVFFFPFRFYDRIPASTPRSSCALKRAFVVLLMCVCL